jgi:anti-sigma-K factor RskA
MNHEDWLAQADIYTLGALDGDELTAFEAHLAAGCPECEPHIRQTREALTLLPQALEPVAPPASLRQRVLTQIAAEADSPQPVIRLPQRRWWVMGVSALIAAGLLIALSFELYQMRQELQRERGVLSGLRAELEQREAALRAEQQDVQRLQSVVASLQTSIAARDVELAKRAASIEAERRELQRVERVVATLHSERDETLRLLSTSQVRLVRLAGLAPSLGANAHLLWNPATRLGVLFASGLPQMPPNRVYELWAIAGNEPVPAGLFEVDEAGHAFLKLPSLPRTRRFDKFAVTDEPAGGVSKPTGQMHLLGSL